MTNDFRVALVMPYHGGKEIPLGLAYIAAVLENEDISVEGIDLNVRKINPSLYKNFDLVGICTSTPLLKNSLREAEKIKRVNPKAFVVLGGPHPTVMPEHTLGSRNVDAIVVGEGEYPMRDIALALMENDNLEDIPGLGYKEDGIPHTNPPKKPPDIDSLPLPAKHIFNLDDYPSKFYALREIIASRGCPYRCANCQPGLRQVSPYRFRSPKKVVDEMEYLREKYGISHVAFLDSELPTFKKVLWKMCDEITERRLKISWSSNVRVNEVSKELLERMRDTGCLALAYGIESGSQRVLDEVINKDITLKESRAVVAETKELGMLSHAYFMVGMPGETKDEIRETINFAKTLDASSMTVSIATPWPGTKFYDIVKERGWLVTDDFTKFVTTNSVIDTPYLSNEETIEASQSFKREFLKRGWRLSKDEISVYSPSYKKEVIKIGLRKIRSHGISRNDVNLILSMIKNRLLS